MHLAYSSSLAKALYKNMNIKLNVSFFCSEQHDPELR